MKVRDEKGLFSLQLFTDTEVNTVVLVYTTQGKLNN